MAVDRRNQRRTLTPYQSDVLLSEMNAQVGGVPPDDGSSSAFLRNQPSRQGNVSEHGSWYFPGGRGQGKLFHDPKPVDEHRWPRGYTPERKLEAQRVAGNFYGDEDRDEYYRFDEGTNDRQYEWVKDTLARSTADLSTFMTEPREGQQPRARIKKLEITDDEFDHPDYQEDSDMGGSWNQGKHYLSMNRALTRQPEQTLMHEMGHAHSTFTDRAASSYYTPEQMGREEGRADAFMAQHWVPHKNNTERPRTDNYRPRDWQAQGKPMEFAKAYRDEHAAQGMRTPGRRQELAKYRQQWDAVKADQRGIQQDDARLFLAYGGHQMEYYGRDRSAQLPTDRFGRTPSREAMADEATGFGRYDSAGNYDPGTIRTQGVPAKDIINNRQLTGRITRQQIENTRRAL